MNALSLVSLLSFYGLFLISCGIISILFIGSKAKTALLSGGITGFLSLFLAYMVHEDYNFAPIAGIALSIFLFGIFSWRATKTLFALFDLIPAKDQGLKGKGIAFLIISLMAVVSIVLCILQIALLPGVVL